MGFLRTFVYCLRLRAHDGYAPEKIARLQLANLRRAVTFAKRHSPFYAELYRGLDPRAPDFNVSWLPPVSKEALMENFDRAVTDPRLRLEQVRQWARQRDFIGRWYLGRYVVAHTSGTTGTPAFFVYNRREWDWIQALGVTRGMRYKPPPGRLLKDAIRVLREPPRIALISVLGGHFVTYLLFKVIPAPARRLARFLYLAVTEPLEKIIDELNRFQPNIIHLYPTILEVLAHEQLAGKLRIDPWAISTSSEPLTRAARKVIGEAFPRSQLFETYGTTEGVTLACGCLGGEGLHVNEDYYIVEPVDAAGRPPLAGQAGDRVYLSCLFLRTLPILRYELTDVVATEPGSCGCGLPFGRVRVRGRTDDIFWVEDVEGKPLALPPIPLEALLLEIDGLRQYQIIQENPELIRVLFRPVDSGRSAELRRQITELMLAFLEQKKVSQRVAVAVEQVEEILRDPQSGKIRQIFSRVERPYLPGLPLGERRTGEDRRTWQMPVGADRRKFKRRDGDDEPK